MGYKSAKLAATGRLSSNNDERDERDEAAWADFMTKVRELASQPEYVDLEIEVNDEGSW